MHNGASQGSQSASGKLICDFTGDSARLVSRIMILVVVLWCMLLGIVAGAQDADVTTESSATAVASPPETVVEAKKVIDFGRDIRPILESKCLECHGPKQAKNDFRVDEQESLFTYVEPGDVVGSSLWTDYLISDDEEMLMPPAAHENPLTGAELAALKLWIEEGAAWSDPVVVAAVAPAEPVAKKSKPMRIAAFAGLFHPAVVHFPVALLLVSCFFCFAAFFRPAVFEGPAFHCLWIGAFSACAASILGWFYADSRGYSGVSFDFSSGLDRHRWTGVALTVFALLLVPVAIAARRQTSSRKMHFMWFFGALALSLVVSIVGHQGGELVYGEEIYTKAFNAIFEEDNPVEESQAIQESQPTPEGLPTQENQPQPAVASPSETEADIKPTDSTN